jgi:bifunctional DNA-binding transcriptional regulator/antitoxin component of YhaV-PrlF toxin-antitoxin module
MEHEPAIMPTLEIPAVVRAKNQLTIPQAIAARHGIEPGRRLVVVDTGEEDQFVVRIVRKSYAGALTGVFFSSTDENVAFIRRMRDEEWE